MSSCPSLLVLPCFSTEHLHYVGASVCHHCLCSQSQQDCYPDGSASLTPDSARLFLKTISNYTSVGTKTDHCNFGQSKVVAFQTRLRKPAHLASDSVETFFICFIWQISLESPSL